MSIRNEFINHSTATNLQSDAIRHRPVPVPARILAYENILRHFVLHAQGFSTVLKDQSDMWPFTEWTLAVGWPLADHFVCSPATNSPITMHHQAMSSFGAGPNSCIWMNENTLGCHFSAFYPLSTVFTSTLNDESHMCLPTECRQLPAGLTTCPSLHNHAERATVTFRTCRATIYKMVSQIYLLKNLVFFFFFGEMTCCS